MLKPSEQNVADPKINKALQYYATHTAQIEVSFIINFFFNLFFRNYSYETKNFRL